MDSRIIVCLRRIFWILGWAVLILVAGSLVTRGYYHFRLGFHPEALESDIFILGELRVLFSSVAQAFFAFLVSAVFEMIFQSDTIDSERTRRFLVITCIAFFAQGSIGVIQWLQSGATVFTTPNLIDARNFFSYLLTLAPSLISFVYAITIYVLFQHFTRLVTFESEVI